MREVPSKIFHNPRVLLLRRHDAYCHTFLCSLLLIIFHPFLPIGWKDLPQEMANQYACLYDTVLADDVTCTVNITFCMQQVLKTMLSNNSYQERQTGEIVLQRDYAENVFNMFLETCHGHDADYNDATWTKSQLCLYCWITIRHVCAQIRYRLVCADSSC